MTMTGAANPQSPQPLTILMTWEDADALDQYFLAGESPAVDQLLAALAQARAAYASVEAAQNMG